MVNGIAGFMKCTRIEFQTDDGKYQDGEHDKESNLHEWRQGFENGFKNHL